MIWSLNRRRKGNVVNTLLTPRPGASILFSMRIVRCIVLGLMVIHSSCSMVPEALRPKDPKPKRRPGFVATWVVRHDIRTPVQVDRIINEAKEAQLGALFVQVRGRGDAFYESALEPKDPGIPMEFDPLASLIEQAHDAGIQIHAWVNVLLVAEAKGLPADSQHVARAHPEWLQVPLALVPDLNQLPPDHQSYVQSLADHAARHDGQVEGLYADPTHPGYCDHVTKVCVDLVRRYEVDGLHLDYIRYPNQDHGYSRAALDRFRVEVDRELDAKDRVDMARRIRGSPTVYARRYPIRWAQFRRDAVTDLVRRISVAAKAGRSDLDVSAAVIPDIERARIDMFQEWPRWISLGLVTAVCPMNYAGPGDEDAFNNAVLDCVAAKGPGRIWMGIAAWKLKTRDIRARMDLAFATGCDGVILFSHESLRTKKGAFEQLASGVR